MRFHRVAGNAAALDVIAAEVLERCARHRLFAVSGPLGAGKTTLIRAFCRNLGVQDKVVSPTFSLINEYEGANRVTHMDLYRLKSMAQALDIGIEDYLGSNNYCFIEWPELVEPLLSPQAVFIDLSVDNHEVRRVTVSAKENGKKNQGP